MMSSRLYIKTIFICLLAAVFSPLNAQLQPGMLVDGIAAVIGDEIVLESDIQEQMHYARQQGGQVPGQCEFLENMINNKLLIYEAKRDTLIEKRTETLQQMAEQKYQQILAQFPDEKTMLNAYKFRTAYEMKNTIEKIDTDNYYGQRKIERITEKTDVTPNEVQDFYNTYALNLPMAKDEIGVSHIFMYPELTDAHKQELIDRLNKIKDEINGGASFESMARIYSEDPGSASGGGLYTRVPRGRMVKPFEAAALNLQEGEISEPVETEYGYHLIQLVKKSGKLYDARHILLKAEPNAAELAAATKKLDSIRTLIKEGKMTFKEAAFKFSDDKGTKFNGGVVTGHDGSDKIERDTLPSLVSYQLAGLKPGDMTEVFEDTENDRKTVNIMMLNAEIPAHRLDLKTDYERIKNMALNKKKNEIVERWVNGRLPDVFISIDKRYSDCGFRSDLRTHSLSN
ncbi:periplasmic chaperone for outer membrane proteins SurA [Cruoricaptor ignavus]|uniref:Periplasmic chaperone for outer membrane proteins SurA n=3 Tax=Cruoricaptor ignavus TaxID=1118202 RepID=A0A1M6EM86_9FLAO|nr:periplasmic chaperone for outer membrane proteins SurA [Cruoricaptor ignavus]